MQLLDTINIDQCLNSLNRCLHYRFRYLNNYVSFVWCNLRDLNSLLRLQVLLGLCRNRRVWNQNHPAMFHCHFVAAFVQGFLMIFPCENISELINQPKFYFIRLLLERHGLSASCRHLTRHCLMMATLKQYALRFPEKDQQKPFGVIIKTITCRLTCMYTVCLYHVWILTVVFIAIKSFVF
jgi:hypothetical protein